MILGGCVWIMMGEAWEADGDDMDDCPDNYGIVRGREFRYDGGRARYLNRELDPEDLMEGDLVSLSDTWTDYDGDTTYGDYAVASGPTITEQRSHEPGLATRDPVGPSSGLKYTHADPLGTTRVLTDYAGAEASSYVYTAFGERIDSGSYLRHGYAGAWGYQAHDVPAGTPIPFLHVGWRWYDPTTGRFLQRDPIGIGGGWNVYEYVRNAPTHLIDPHGLVAFTWFGPNLLLGNICGVGGIAISIALVAAQRWDEHTAHREEMADRILSRPFDPDDPWGWTDELPEAESWRRRKNKPIPRRTPCPPYLDCGEE